MGKRKKNSILNEKLHQFSDLFGNLLVDVDSLSLKNASGDFYDTLTVNLELYDAGSDSGVTFTSVNSDDNSVISRALNILQHIDYIELNALNGRLKRPEMIS